MGSASRALPRRRAAGLVRPRAVRRAELGSHGRHHSMSRARTMSSRDGAPRVRPPEAELRAIRGALLAWYDRNRRDLPWRRTRDPYAIWVSEMMLQQTQVATVLRYFPNWMRRFPSVRALAGAPEADVLHAWQGLGYYSRARRLHAGARFVVEPHAGDYRAPTRGCSSCRGSAHIRRGPSRASRSASKNRWSTATSFAYWRAFRPAGRSGQGAAAGCTLAPRR